MTKESGAPASGTGSHAPHEAPTGFDPSRRTVLLTTRFEPKPLWHWIGRKWIVIAYFRPADVGVGIQFMWGGLALIVWPFLIAFCNHQKMPSGPRDRDASLAEDAKRLSPEGVAARAEGIAQPLSDTTNKEIAA